MKTRRTALIFGALLFCALAAPLRAQGPGGAPPMAERPEHELKRLDKKLKLTDEQKTEVLTILKERSSALAAVLDDQNTSMPEKFPQISKLIEDGNSRIRELLTPDQRIKFEDLLAEEASQRGRRPEGGPMNGPPDGLAPPPQM